MVEPSGLEAPPAFRAAGWTDLPGLRHGFFGRRGGVSSGPLATLNLSESVGDAPQAVAENWRRVGTALPGLTPLRMRQVHGAHVARVDRADQTVGEADGMLTAVANVGVAVLTADCVPILGVAPAARLLLAVHAGWRGTLAGIAAAAIEEARRSYGVEPSAWRIALGPAIDSCCYEVEEAIGRRMTDRWGAMADAWQRHGDHGQLDLRAVNRHILKNSGVPGERIELVGPCTSCATDELFSHRRSGGTAGRQASIIGWA